MKEVATFGNSFILSTTEESKGNVRLNSLFDLGYSSWNGGGSYTGYLSQTTSWGSTDSFYRNASYNSVPTTISAFSDSTSARLSLKSIDGSALGTVTALSRYACLFIKNLKFDNPPTPIKLNLQVSFTVVSGSSQKVISDVCKIPLNFTGGMFSFECGANLFDLGYSQYKEMSFLIQLTDPTTTNYQLSSTTMKVENVRVNETIYVEANGTLHSGCNYCNTNKYICSNETEWNGGYFNFTDPRTKYQNHEIESIRLELIRYKFCSTSNSLSVSIKKQEIAVFAASASFSTCSCDNTCKEESSTSIIPFDSSRFKIGEVDSFLIHSSNYICLASVQISMSLKLKDAISEPFIYSPSNKEQKSPGGVIGGTIVAVLLIIVGVVSVVVFLIYRKKRINRSIDLKMETINEESQYSSIGAKESRNSITYAPINLSTLNNKYSSEISSSLNRPRDLNSKYIIPSVEIFMMNELGKGAFGTWRSTDVAIKKLKSEILTIEQVDEFMQEVYIMMSMKNHTNVVTFLGLCENPLCLITEFLENGSLDRYLRNKSNEMSYDLQIKIIKGIAAGMHHLQCEKIVHKDLAARNILLDKNFVPKVSDFGLSRLHEENSEDDLQ